MVLYKKIFRNILEHKSKYLSSLLLVAISTALFIAFSISGPQSLDAIEKFRKDYKVEDASFITASEINNIDNLEKELNIELEKRREYDAKILKGATLRLLEKSDKINKYQVTEGEDLSSKGDILLNKDFVIKNNMKIGQNIDINEKSYLIKGYFSSPDYLYVLKNETDIVTSPTDFGIGIITKESMNLIDKPQYVYNINFNGNITKEIKDTINKKYVVLKWLSGEDNPRVTAINGDVGGFFQLGKIVPIFILLITSLLIAIVQWRLIKSEFNQLGTLYALGYSKRKLLFHYLTYPILITLLGSIIGIAPGLLLCRPLIATQAIQYNLPTITLEIKPWIIILAILLPFIIIVPVCLRVIMKALKYSPVKLMKGILDEEGPSFLEKHINLKALNFDLRFKIREVIRNLPRTMLTFVSIIFASLLLLFGFIINDSINWVFNNGYEETFKYEYVYIFNSLHFEKGADGEKFWLQNFTAENRKSESINLKLQSLEKDAKLIKLIDEKGNTISFSKNIITLPLAEKLGVKSGDSISIKSKIDDKIIQVKIDEIANNYIGDFIFIPLEDFYSKLDLPKNSYLGMLSESELNYDKADLSSKMEKKALTGGFKEMTKPLKSLLFFIAGAASFIGLILIYVVTSLIIEENRNNISLLKILGYQKKKIYSLILNSNTVIVILAYIVSLPLAKMSLNSLFKVVTSNMDFSIPAKIDTINIFIGFIIIMVTYELAKLLTRRKVVSIPMTEALKAARE
jgi:putative ABC transport system permease protein